MPKVTLSSDVARKPIKPSASKSESLLPESAVSPMFHYAHFRAWDFIDGFGFVPRLGRLMAVGGVSGSVLRGNTVDDSEAIANAERKGGVVLRNGDPRLGEHAEYLAGYDCEGGGVHWTFAGHVLEIIGRGKRKQVKIKNPEVFVKFRADLVGKVVEHINDAEYGELIAIERRKLERMIARHESGRLIADAVQAQRDRVDAIEKAYRDLCEPSEHADAKPAKPAARKAPAK